MYEAKRFPAPTEGAPQHRCRAFRRRANAPHARAPQGSGDDRKDSMGVLPEHPERILQPPRGRCTQLGHPCRFGRASAQRSSFGKPGKGPSGALGTTAATAYRTVAERMAKPCSQARRRTACDHDSTNGGRGTLAPVVAFFATAGRRASEAHS